MLSLAKIAIVWEKAASFYSIFLLLQVLQCLEDNFFIYKALEGT